MFDFLQALWEQFRYGYAESCHISVSVDRRDVALDFQRYFIEAGLDCRVEMTDRFSYDNKDVVIDNSTMVIVTEFSGGMLNGPSSMVYVMQLKDTET
jgi:hypothetical protein